MTSTFICDRTTAIHGTSTVKYQMKAAHYHNIGFFSLSPSFYCFSKPVFCVMRLGAPRFLIFACTRITTQEIEKQYKRRKTQWTHGRTIYIYFFFSFFLFIFIYIFTVKKIHFSSSGESVREKRPSKMRAIKVHCIPSTKAHLLPFIHSQFSWYETVE